MFKWKPEKQCFSLTASPVCCLPKPSEIQKFSLSAAPQMPKVLINQLAKQLHQSNVITCNSPERWFYIPVIPQKAPHSLRNMPIRCRSNLFNLIFAYPGFTSKGQVQLPATWGVVHDTDLRVKHKLGNWCRIWPVAFVNNLLINHLCHFSSASPLWMQEHFVSLGELKWWCGLRRVSPFSTWEQRSCVINAQDTQVSGRTHSHSCR